MIGICNALDSFLRLHMELHDVSHINVNTNLSCKERINKIINVDQWMNLITINIFST